MIPSKPNILRCPHCGGLRRVRSIMSGNTIGEIFWSDGKIDYPMLPSVSKVLRCPVCKKYHFYESSQIVGKCKSWGNASWGKLSYASLKETMEQLKPTGKEEETLRMMIHWAYNDLYWGVIDAERQTKEYLVEREYFIQNTKAIIALNPDKPLFCAELYREIEEFEQCIKTLYSIKQHKDERTGFDIYDGRILIRNFEKVKNRILHKALLHDSKVYAEFHGRDEVTREPVIEGNDESQYIYDPDNDPEEEDWFDRFHNIDDDEEW